MTAGNKIAQMRVALTAAANANTAEVPVGAAVFDGSGKLLATATNTRQTSGDYAGHAEINALNLAAQKLGERVLSDCTLVVTLEPCVMCAGAILASRVARVIFGAWDAKAGACGSVYDVLRDGYLPHPVPQVAGGVLAAECAQLLSNFFVPKRS